VVRRKIGRAEGARICRNCGPGGDHAVPDHILGAGSEWPRHAGKPAGSGKRPFFIGGCHSWRTDGPSSPTSFRNCDQTGPRWIRALDHELQLMAVPPCEALRLDNMPTPWLSSSRLTSRGVRYFSLARGISCRRVLACWPGMIWGNCTPARAGYSALRISITRE